MPKQFCRGVFFYYLNDIHDKICTITGEIFKKLLYKMTNTNKQCKKILKCLEIFIVLWYYIICETAASRLWGMKKLMRCGSRLFESQGHIKRMILISKPGSRGSGDRGSTAGPPAAMRQKAAMQKYCAVWINIK